MRSLSLSKSPGIVKEPQPLDFIPAPAFAAGSVRGGKCCENSEKVAFRHFFDTRWQSILHAGKACL